VLGQRWQFAHTTLRGHQLAFSVGGAISTGSRTARTFAISAAVLNAAKSRLHRETVLEVR
jgi:hypothetical protein